MPAVVGTSLHLLGLLVLLGFLHVQVPRLEYLYSELGLELPVLTQVVLRAADASWLIFLLAPALVVDAASLALVARQVRPLAAWLLSGAGLFVLVVLVALAVAGLYLPAFEMQRMTG